MRVGVDLDGVCYDFDADCRAWIIGNGILPAEALVPTVRWHMYRDWGMTDAEFVAMCDDATDAGFMFCQGEPMAGAMRGLRQLKDDGHTIHLVTARHFGSPGSSESNTAWWLDQWDVPYDSLTMSGDKTAVEVDVFIDDRDRNYDEIEAKWPGVAVLMDRAYNRHHDGRRVYGWRQFVGLVRNKAIAESDGADIWRAS